MSEEQKEIDALREKVKELMNECERLRYQIQQLMISG